MEPAAAPTSPITSLLEELHEKYAKVTDGAVADYIPPLATALPEWFGICLVTADGNVYEVGDTRREFTIQSISKPLTYALAIEAIGESEVRKHVDVEPSGEAFNSITLQPGTGIPLNPMVNAGAIATTSLIKPLGFEEPIDRILHEYSGFAGRELEVDEAVFESENETGNRNRAIAYLLKNSDVIEDDVEDVVETYFRQCSTLVDCRDLAVIAATLASTGVNPITSERVVREDTVRDVLSVMASCGMYNSAGDWLYNVGLPAKSGVAGGIIAVLPGVLGIAVYSPPLDAHGNSVRGVEVCRELSRELRLHVMSPTRRPPPAIRASHSCVETRSKRMRTAAEQQVLTENGNAVKVFELQGEISFAAGELITNAVLEETEAIRYVILDFRTVRSIDPVEVPIISNLIDTVEMLGETMVFTDVDRHPEFLDSLDLYRTELALGVPRIFPDLDLGLEWCEHQLLADHGMDGQEKEMSLAQHNATLGMSPEEIAELHGHLEHVTFEAGSGIFEGLGEVANEMLLITKGKISVVGRMEDGSAHRFATLAPGIILGQIAMISNRPPLGSFRVDTDVAAYSLGREDLNALQESNPQLTCKLLENLIKAFAVRLTQLSREISR